ncbi:hypothetical protein GWI33_009970 [Rhynchophorus ferrugineus]|uniref:Uncharacterized protein n=1 Tax=Rhynchophorus ferrugineus TaxID=354439 RepID=A0A834ITH6_RHYFE|nr:hypothetical protein GWI33_009970 [Rhynchophorus ferrugineus]
MWRLCAIFVLWTFSYQVDGRVTASLTSDFEEYKYMNSSVDPCEDFYEYSCGNFKNYYPLQEDELLIDQFSILEEKLTSIVKEILEAAESEEDPLSLLKAKAAYSACMKENYQDSQYMKSPEVQVVKKYGGFPIVEEAGKTNDPDFGWNDIADIAAEFGINVFLSVTSSYDIQNSSAMMLMISDDTTSIPDQFRPMYPESYDEAIKEGFHDFATKNNNRASLAADDGYFEIFLKKLVKKLNRDLGSWETEQYIIQKVSEISSFMNGFYNGGYIPENVTGEDFDNIITLNELNDWTYRQFGNSIQIDWIEYMKTLFKYTYVNITGETKIQKTGNLNNTLYGILNWVKMTDPKIVKSTALIKAFVYMASDSDGETRSDFETFLSAIGKTVYPRWEYCTRKIMDITETLSLSLAVAYEYQLKYFNKTKFDSVTDLITKLQSTFKEVINEAEWMDDSSKEAAYKKVDNIFTLLGYPKFTSDREALDYFYQNLPICKWDHYQNSRNLRAFKQAYVLNMISKRNKAAWDKSPFITNAYYNRQNNIIIFPVAMLNSIFFSGSKSLLDYSRIGMIVAHEITHGFDSQGYFYNEDGVIQPWWTTTTRTNFQEKVTCFVDQYSQYIVPELNATMNSANSLNENLADNGGTRTAFKALKKMLASNKNTELTPTDDFSYDQMFFIGFGTMWCNSESVDYLNLLKTTCDTSSSCHPRAKIRVNGVVSNMKEFAEAFQCPVGSPMNPETKCQLW